MGYQITLFLVLIVYLEVISDRVPIPNDLSEVPKIVIFFVLIIIMLGFTVSITAVTMVVHFETGWRDTDQKKLTEFEVKLCYGLAQIFNVLFKCLKIDIPRYIEEMKEYYLELKKPGKKQGHDVAKNKTQVEIEYDAEGKPKIEQLLLTIVKKLEEISPEKDEGNKVKDEEGKPKMLEYDDDGNPKLPMYDEIGRNFLADMINRLAFIVVSMFTFGLVVFWGVYLFIGRERNLLKIDELEYLSS